MNKSFLTSSNKTLKQSYSFGFGSGFIVFMAYSWASTIIQEWGQKPSQQISTVLGLTLGFLIALYLFDYILWRWQFTRAIRSGLWAGAAIGSYATLFAWTELAHPVWSHVIGLTSTVFAFVIFYSLDNIVQSKQP
jgi:preprotein translocase subunit SecE